MMCTRTILFFIMLMSSFIVARVVVQVVNKERIFLSLKKPEEHLSLAISTVMLAVPTVKR